MTNQWYFRVGEEELGPVTFRELAELVRFGVIGERDFVRSFWKETPQRVDSVVGLLYQSRQPRPALPQPTAETPTIVEHLAAIEIEERADPARPDWLQRLLELQSSLNTTPAVFQTPPGSGDPQSDQISTDDLVEPVHVASDPESDIDVATASTGMNADVDELPGMGERSSAWESTMGAALSHVGVDTAPPTKPGVAGSKVAAVLALPWRVLTYRPFLSRVFRVGCMVGMGIIVFGLVQEWSAREAMRFPMRRPYRQDGKQEPTPRNFPYIGRCTETEYTLLMINTVLVGSLAAYGVAAYLESRAE